MTYKDAYRFIHPDTCVQAVEEVDDDVVFDKMREACLLACEALEHMSKSEDDLK